MTLRLASILALLVLWQAASLIAASPTLPSPAAVGSVLAAEARSGALVLNLGATLARVVAAFVFALSIGSAIGIAMGRSPATNRVLDPWLIVLINLPALVVIVLAYIWLGLNEVAAILAVSLNKLPIAIVTLREGARTLDPQLEDVAQVFAFSPAARLRHVALPQLAPYIASAARTGLAIVWKIVLVVELIGRPNGVGYEIGSAFQLFDVARILAYALAFVAIMLAIEFLAMQPLEKHHFRWRQRPA